MNGDRWSVAICDRYQLQLSDELTDWFDGAHCRFQSQSEFSNYTSIPDLLDRNPRHLWPGFMQPDTLPVIGNRFGDWLCMRIDPQGQVSEIVHWYHGGGDFLPFGSTLAEALLYDQCQSVRFDYHSWGEVVPLVEGRPLILEWIAKWLTTTVVTLSGIVQDFSDGRMEEGLSKLSDHGWCQAAVARDRIDLALQTPLRVQADPKLALRLGVDWEKEMTRWLFDTNTIPSEYLAKLTEMLSQENPTWFQQSWSEAERTAQEVVAIRSDLAWAFDIAGWGAFRRGETNNAIDLWWNGLHASLFSDQSTRLRSHWFDQRFGKFAAAQLYRLREHLSENQRSDPYWKELVSETSEETHRRISRYWTERAKEPGLSAAEQYECWYRAGWDIGCQEVEVFDRVLAGLEEAARHADWGSRAELAATYRTRLHRRKS